ncbi:MAG: pseudouridine synthase [Gammaproteobacteria bacterium]|nr:pseudouridine synthase [Gammaproteobacteria bacterium]
MRLDRFVSQAAAISRSQARSAIRRGAVSVDGAQQRDAGHILAEGTQVTLAGRLLAMPQPHYLMLHKPCGLVSATRDAHQQTVLSLLPPELASRVHLVGRLDKDTSGLLLLTDDGAWSHTITSPARHCAKVYRAELAAPLTSAAITQLRSGVQLRSEARPTRPATVEPLAGQQVRITLSEGRYHQVRRMFAAVGNHVTALHREQIGGLVLDLQLAPGRWRPLSPAEKDAVLG